METQPCTTEKGVLVFSTGFLAAHNPNSLDFTEEMKLPSTELATNINNIPAVKKPKIFNSNKLSSDLDD
ncbi:hypothetical protein CHU_3565 [Cytophaga hutchinsonii ATCC 33406]|uniref:Uncharacterized protein n=1 Tax=Cytophaga hutchinsonii (strain ATCC 33406 / DSM 1761 / CIP 103989 / NBRC 15051 / NCIMB 9469 / D465) TaxID=269798 RepID=A0A6N4SWF0_CYTH3|nr:hypothetical protein CHU_3565 [Cytophaga hutchinsonii ATCC 33406]